jgi:hypothetical protein
MAVPGAIGPILAGGTSFLNLADTLIQRGNLKQEEGQILICILPGLLRNINNLVQSWNILAPGNVGPDGSSLVQGGSVARALCGRISGSD